MMLLLLWYLRIGHAGTIGTLWLPRATGLLLLLLRNLIRPWTTGAIALLLLLLLPLPQSLLGEVDRLRLGNRVLRFEGGTL